MKEELAAFETNHTWIMTYLSPLGKSTIKCPWIYKIKHNSDSFIEHCKARLVIKYYSQHEGLDFLDTFAPFAKLTTLRLLLALIATNSWILKQLNINNAFPDGDLHEEVYMKVPPGLIAINKKVFVNCKDHCLDSNKLDDRGMPNFLNFYFLIIINIHPFFYNMFGHSIIALLIYVDDIVLTGNDVEEMHTITSFLHHHFRIRNLGDLTYFLGLEVARNNTRIHLSLRKYVLYLLPKVGMLACARMSTHMVHIVHLSANKGLKLNNKKLQPIKGLLDASFILQTLVLI